MIYVGRFQVHDYVRSYLGETKDAIEFAKQFLERRSKYNNEMRQQQNQEDEVSGNSVTNLNFCHGVHLVLIRCHEFELIRKRNRED